MPPTYAAALIVFFEGLVLWAVFPVTSFYCQQLGGGAVWVGVMFALLSAPKILSNPIFGALSDRFGRRPLLAIASLGTLCGSLGWALAPSIGWLAVSRLVAGLFSAQSALCQTVVADSNPPERRAAGLGVVGAAFGLSMVVGPLLGGWVAGDVSHPAVGWMCAAIQALSLLTVTFLLKETRPSAALSPARADATPRVPQPLRQRQVTPLLGVTFLMAFTVAQLTSTFSLFTQQQYGFSEKHAGHAFAFFGLIGVLVQGGFIRPLVPRLGEQRTALAGLVALGVGFGLLAAQPAAWVMWLGTAILAAGTALSMPTVTALLTGCANERAQGALLGLQQSVMSLGRGAGSGVAGWVYDLRGPGVSYALATVGAVLAVLLLLPVRARTDRPAGCVELVDTSDPAHS
jgi:MFS family permease